MQIKIDVAPGELIDKITILEIKLEQISDAAKLKNVRHEYQLLLSALADLPALAALTPLRAELKSVNQTIWDIEDRIRDHERRKDFGPSFVETARGVYFNNDHRARVKRQINDLLGSALTEEKSYTKY